MTARASLAMVKHVEAGAAVSYGRTWIAEHPTTLGLVPVGYADGLPRVGGNRAEAPVAGQTTPLRGRICMDQLVVDLDGDDPGAGADVVIFGPASDGEPTAQDWAEACGTISYEIVTRIGGRFPRRYVDRSARDTRHERPPSHPRGRRRCGRRWPRPARRSASAGRAAPSNAARVDETPFGSLRSTPVTVVADDGVPLLRRGRRARSGPAATGEPADPGLLPRLRPQPRLLALPARGLPGAGPRGLLRPALARPLRALAGRPRDHRPARPRPPRGPRRASCPRARSSWSVTPWAACRSSPSPSSTPS